MKNVLIINGSITGNKGNTNEVLKHCEEYLSSQKMNCKIIHLADQNPPSDQDYKQILEWADGYVFSTGTYWDSWGSPMQKFFEEITQFEAKEEILFKPCSVIVTMHAFGGKEVLSRMQGVLNTMGFSIPPMSGLVYGLATQTALEANNSFSKDFWSLEDLEIVLANLITSITKEYKYLSWPVDQKDPKRRWITCDIDTGPLK